MRLCIPTIGTELVLSKDWQFRLFFEKRNYKLLDKLDLLEQAEGTAHNTHGQRMEPSRYSAYYWDSDQCVLAMLPKGTRIKVDRIYIRKGRASVKNFDSVTFWVRDGSYKGARFWAKLMDVNLIECDIDESTIPESYREGIEVLEGWDE